MDDLKKAKPKLGPTYSNDQRSSLSAPQSARPAGYATTSSTHNTYRPEIYRVSEGYLT